MRIVGSSNRVRTVYAWQEGDEFLLSPFAEAIGGRRPLDRFESREALEAHVEPRGCEVQWLAS